MPKMGHKYIYVQEYSLFTHNVPLHHIVLPHLDAVGPHGLPERLRSMIGLGALQERVPMG